MPAGLRAPADSLNQISADLGTLHDSPGSDNALARKPTNRLPKRGNLKIHHVHTIARVAEMLGEDEDWLWDIANEMDQEDGLIWVYDPGDEGVMAFTDFGIETLTGIVEIYKADPERLKRSNGNK